MTQVRRRKWDRKSIWKKKFPCGALKNEKYWLRVISFVCSFGFTCYPFPYACNDVLFVLRIRNGCFWPKTPIFISIHIFGLWGTHSHTWAKEKILDSYARFMTKRNHEYIQFLARKKLPVKAGWRNGSIKYFLRKMDEGSDDTGTLLTYTKKS